MAKKKAPAKKSIAKNSLVGNINKRKKAGTSRSKKDSTISPQAYEEMQQGWSKKKGRQPARKRATTKAKS